MKRLLLTAPITSAALLLFFTSCSDSNSGTGGKSSMSNGTGSSDGGAGGSTTAQGLATTGTSGMCTTSADCNGGVCNHGVCCGSAADVCDTACCTAGQVCFSNACVTPGNDCHSAADCPDGQYCEPSLATQGTGGGGTTGSGGVCTAPVPSGGKCLPLPVVCDQNNQPPGCTPPCEYHPPPGPLNAVTKWTWGPTAVVKPNFTDVWSTPTVGRVYDSNCDGTVNELDSPVIAFVSGNDLAGAPAGTNCQSATLGGTNPSMCHTGVLRMLDGASGQEIWSLANDGMGSVGFAGMSIAFGDIDGDGKVDVVATTGEGYVELISSTGAVLRKSDKPIPGNASATFGWGGGLSIADMDGDGHPEIAFGSTIFSTTNGAITLAFTGGFGIGGGNVDEALSTFVDLDGAPDNHLELLAGNTAYNANGSVLWHNAAVPDGFPGVGDFNVDGHPDVALVGNGKLWILDGATGVIELGPLAIPGTGSGGPPTVADFDGDGKPEIGVAMATFYSVLKPDYTNNKIDVLWKTPNHDLSSSVTGSTVFDFEGDGKAEVIYADECFLWVFDGQTGAVRFAAPHTSFTGTEASLVADVDGDGRADIVMVTNGADPSSAGWGCLDASGAPQTINGVTWTPSALPNKSYRGIQVFEDSADSWVGTRTLWNEHTYHVSNICDDRDSACGPPNVYGSIPKVETKNWTLPWLNNFRQNVQDKGLFDAPDATVTLAVPCVNPLIGNPSVRNVGLASLPSGVKVALFVKKTSGDVQLGEAVTTKQLLPGQTEVLSIPIDGSMATQTDTFYARIIVDPVNPTFHECNTMNDDSPPVTPQCVM